jgi:hypothetical protein
VLKLLGKLGKGLATIIGVVLVGGGVGTGVVTNSNGVTEAVQTISQNLPALITAIGVLLAAFGIGRKAGDAAAKEGG